MIKKGILFITFIIVIALIYVSSAMYSLHQVHKSIYYNNKQISKNYIEWDTVKTNFKDYINASFLDKISNDKEFEDLDEIGIFVASIASKVVEYAIDTYINPEGLSLLIKNSSKKSEIPEPNFATFIGGISLIKFNSLNTFSINLDTDENNMPVYFKRIGVQWKVIEIVFPKDIFNESFFNLNE